MTIERENTPEASSPVERWRKALALALSELGLSATEQKGSEAGERAEQSEARFWWAVRDSSSGRGLAVFGFGAAAENIISELAKPMEAPGDFHARILERAAVLADHGAAGRVTVSPGGAPQGDFDIVRFSLEDGTQFEIALAYASAEANGQASLNRHSLASDRMGILLKVAVPVTVLMGKANLPLKETLKLARGSVVDLDRTFNDPVEVVVNDQVVARGDIVVVEEKYAVRIREVCRDASGQAWTRASA